MTAEISAFLAHWWPAVLLIASLAASAAVLAAVVSSREQRRDEPPAGPDPLADLLARMAELAGDAWREPDASNHNNALWLAHNGSDAGMDIFTHPDGDVTLCASRGAWLDQTYINPTDEEMLAAWQWLMEAEHA